MTPASGAPERVPIKNLDRRPLLRTIIRQMKSAFESFMPGRATALAHEIWCSDADDAVLKKAASAISARLQDDDFECDVLLARCGAAGDAQPEILESALVSGLAGAMRLLHAHSARRINLEIHRLAASALSELLNSGVRLCIRWRITGAAKPVELVQVFPDAFFAALGERVFGAKRDAGEFSDIDEFVKMLDALEAATTNDFPDGLPDMEFQTSWVFAGGQCAEVNWRFDVSDLFSLPPGGLQALLQEIRKRDLHDTFITACISCLPAAVAALSRGISRQGLADMKSRARARAVSTPPHEQQRAEFEILSIALELHAEGKLDAPPQLREKLDQAIDEHASPSRFNGKRALADFTALLLGMSAPDLQLAITRLPRNLLALALAPESHLDLLNLHRAVRDNTPDKLWKELAEEIQRATSAKNANRGPARPTPTMARLQCIDLIRGMASRNIFSPPFHSRDADYLSDDMIKTILEASKSAAP